MRVSVSELPADRMPMTLPCASRMPDPLSPSAERRSARTLVVVFCSKKGGAKEYPYAVRMVGLGSVMVPALNRVVTPFLVTRSPFTIAAFHAIESTCAWVLRPRLMTAMSRPLGDPVGGDAADRVAVLVVHLLTDVSAVAGGEGLGRRRRHRACRKWP